MFKTDILHALLSLLQVNGGRLKQKNTTLIALYLTSLLMPPNHEEDKDHSIGHSYDDDDDDDDDKNSNNISNDYFILRATKTGACFVSFGTKRVKFKIKKVPLIM